MGGGAGHWHTKPLKKLQSTLVQSTDKEPVAAQFSAAAAVVGFLLSKCRETLDLRELRLCDST